MDKVSGSHLISFSRYQTNVLLSFYLDHWWCQTLRLFLDQPVMQWLTGRKTAEDRNTQIWISQEQKSFLDDTENIFHSF